MFFELAQHVDERVLRHPVQLAEPFRTSTNADRDRRYLRAQGVAPAVNRGEPKFHRSKVTELDDGSRGAIRRGTECRRSFGHHVREPAPLVDHPVKMHVQAEELGPVRAPLQLLASERQSNEFDKRELEVLADLA